MLLGAGKDLSQHFISFNSRCFWLALTGANPFYVLGSLVSPETILKLAITS